MSLIDNDLPVPYFYTNKNWYYYDDEEGKYKLTDKATEKARESYYKLYKEKDDE